MAFRVIVHGEANTFTAAESPSNRFAVTVYAPQASGCCGPAGAAGTIWYNGTAAPAADLGKAGDYYFQDSGTIYRKGDSWQIIFDISSGAAGWLFGVADPPAPELGELGNRYFSSSTANVYSKDALGWQFQLCLKGAAGAPGVGVPTGGAVGQVLSKTGAADYQTGWTDPLFTASEAANFVAGDKNKLDGIEPGAQVNVQADWSAAAGGAKILNKPAIPEQLADLAEDAYHRVITDAERSGWNAKAEPLGYTPENAANLGAASGYASLDDSGRVPAAQLGSGTPDGSKFLRDDGSWQAVAGVGGVRYLTFIVPGTLVVATNLARLLVPFACAPVECRANVDGAPTGAGITLDLHYDANAGASGAGATIWANQAQRPTIAAGANSVTVTDFGTTSFAAWSSLELHLDAVGSTAPGNTLQVVLEVQETGA